MNQPKVSVCLPTRNGDKHLNKTIKSILNQNYKNFELLISDNNSNDKTKKILRKYKKYKLIKIFTQKNILTMMENYNYLIKKAKSNYLVFIHDDDLWNRKYLSSGIKTLLKDKTSVAVFGKIKRFKNNMKVYKYEIETKKFDGKLSDRIENFFKYNFGDKFIFSIFHKRRIQNLFFLNNILAPEIVLIYNVLLSGKIIAEKDMVYFKRYKFIRNKNEKNKVYSINSNFFTTHGAFIFIFFDLLKKFKLTLILKLLLYRHPTIRFLFRKKLTKI